MCSIVNDCSSLLQYHTSWLFPFNFKSYYFPTTLSCPVDSIFGNDFFLAICLIDWFAFRLCWKTCAICNVLSLCPSLSLFVHLFISLSLSLSPALPFCKAAISCRPDREGCRGMLTVHFCCWAVGNKQGWKPPQSHTLLSISLPLCLSVCLALPSSHCQRSNQSNIRFKSSAHTD